MDNDEQESLTADDVAKLLHVSKSTVYNLVRRGDLHSYKVGRKTRFTRKHVSDYIAWSSSKEYVAQNKGTGKAKDKAPSYRTWLEKQSHEKSLTICGHDMILDVLANYLNQSGIAADRAYVSSYDGLIMLYHGEAQVASVHMWDARSGEYNEPYVRQLLPGIPAVIIRLATRIQGLCVAEGNPKKILSWDDLKREDIRFGNREKGTGSRVLTDGHLSLLGINPAKINGYDNEYPSTLALAEAVAAGEIDVGVGNERTIHQVEGVDFVALQKEQYDLVMTQETMRTPEGQALLHVIRSLPFKKQFHGMDGYETGQMGRIVARL